MKLELPNSWNFVIERALLTGFVAGELWYRHRGDTLEANHYLLLLILLVQVRKLSAF